MRPRPAAGGHYFAYGSNLSSARMRKRVPSARAVCAATLDDHQLTLGKPGRDGSGKATLVRVPGALCWGVVYAIDTDEWDLLDACEPGYGRTSRIVTTVARERLAVETYLAPATAPDPVATPLYKSFIVDGAREHGLPADYVGSLERLPVRREPDGLS